MEEAVCLRSFVLGDGRGDEVIRSLGADVLRESHENGLVSFLVGGAGAGRFADAGGAGGGGENGTAGRAPDSPCSGALSGLGGNSGG
jgi:hypothetical protein